MQANSHASGGSPHSCETYAYSFRLLFAFAAKRTGTRPSRIQIEQFDAALILDFLMHIERERGNGPATRNVRLTAIKAFMHYAEYRVPSALEQIGQIRAIPTKRYEQKLTQHLTMEEVRAVLNAPDITTRLGVRDRAMLHLCFAAGLRVPELFVNAEGAAMTRAGFEYVLDKHATAAAKTCPSLKGRSVSPHQLRHSCAVIMLQATHDIRKVALWLGHADVRTTEVYLRMDAAAKLEAFEAVLPPELRRGRFKAPDALIASLLADEASPMT